MIHRHAQSTLIRLAQGFPVIAITGPRQSGKTTLAKACFAEKPYVSLENPDDRMFAQTDPKGFLARYPNGAIIDEIQRVPELLSWLQGIVDQSNTMGLFVITGSAQFELIASIGQSLAGRVGRLELLPLTMGELGEAASKDLDSTLLKGMYPSLYDRPVDPDDWFSNYVNTYLERDVRQLIAIKDLGLFQRFIRLCAARSGQMLNLASLGADCGISGATAKQWLTVLEASYVLTLIQPYHNNFGKRLTKAPKLYFLDTGILCWLLGIHSAKMLNLHAYRGAIFETWVFSELIKARYNEGKRHKLYYWRDSNGHEVDVIIEKEAGLQAIEIKSGQTYVPDWQTSIAKWEKLIVQAHPAPMIVYGGDESYIRQGLQIKGWYTFGTDPYDDLGE